MRKLELGIAPVQVLVILYRVCHKEEFMHIWFCTNTYVLVVVLRVRNLSCRVSKLCQNHYVKLLRNERKPITTTTTPPEEVS